MATTRKTKNTSKDSQPKLIIRIAEAGDIPAVQKLFRRIYKDMMEPYSDAQLRGQISRFSQGQYVAEYEGDVVGYSASFRISEKLALKPHTWDEITGSGYASRHDAEGGWLYGLEVFVDPEYQGLRIGQRFYNARKALVTQLNLKGIVFGGRLPGLSKKWKLYGSAEEYVQAVSEKRQRDQVLSFQIRNGFEVIGVLPKYFPTDHESRGYACHLVWRNSKYIAPEPVSDRLRGRITDTVRVGAIQYQQRRVASFDEFAHQVEYFIDVIADYKGDFAVLPELFTLQLLSIENRHVPPAEAIAALTKYTERLKTMLSDLAVAYNINIIGGSHPTLTESGDIMNICYICLRDGSIHQQAKIHPTPSERYWWNIVGGSELAPIQTDCGPIGVMICYDSEFPEMARHLVDQGAQILFVPFCTDERQSYLRVRYCGQARAVENQCYVVLAGNVGNLPYVDNMDIQYAQSCILTPCDFPFARDGVAADTTPNVEMIAFSDLRLDDLGRARKSGTVQNLNDRRFDLYSVRWKGPKSLP